MTDYSFGQTTQDKSFSNVNVRNTLEQCKPKIRAKCITVDTLTARNIFIVEEDVIETLIPNVVAQDPIEGDGSLATPLFFNRPNISGYSGVQQAGIVPGTFPIVTADYAPIETNGLIIDNTGVTPGEFIITLPGLYRIYMAVDVSTSVPPGVVSVTDTRLLLDGAPFGTESHTYDTSVVNELVSVNDHLGQSIYVQLIAGQSIILAKDTTNTVMPPLGISWSNQSFSIEWIAP
jgi:hypothetical protein